MDDTAKYKDSEGNNCTIRQMINREPYWAANRLQEGEKAIERVKLLEDSDKVFRQVIQKLTDDNNGMTPGWLLDLVP